MRSTARHGVLAAALLWTGVAEAGSWRTYLHLGAGVALDHLSDWDARGAALQGYLGVETPVGLSLGVVAEGAETWGRQLGDFIQDPSEDAARRVELDYRSMGLELRMRFFRDRMISPWLGARIAISRSTPLTPDEAGNLVRQSFENTSTALRFGLDWWMGEHFAVTGSTSWQWCDVRSGGEEIAAGLSVSCTRPLQTILLGPTLRF
ncbi:hypothetical protein P2318_32235 [Myxococcaceae bacterium GXIMD 01537]